MNLIKNISLSILVTLLFLGQASANLKITIVDDNDRLSLSDEQRLESQVLKAASFYQSEMSYQSSEVRIQVDPVGRGCLRTGYNFKEKEVVFCPKKDIQNMGLDSTDVIYHETFHYLFCQQYPQNCERAFLKDKRNEAIHEGLADFFTYKLSPNQYFGENFKLGVSFLREYQNDLCFNLTGTPHLMGSAISSYLIKSNLELKDLSLFFQSFDFKDLSNDPCFQDRHQPLIEVQGRKQSKFNKYWLKKNESIEFQVHLRGQYDYRTFDPLMIFDMQIQNNRITFNAGENSGIEIIYLIISQNGKELGVQKLLLGVRKE